ncbi:MAG: DEAD/DEAH box helicase family protein [Anaerolineaceae bacterium]|nr:DEAD/DEAH box helicase family protein [Anaerolineaceae bacterium]
MRSEFEEFLNLLQRDSSSEYDKGKRFEEIIRRALERHPIYRSRFTRVQSFRAWAYARGEKEQDTGIDIVAEREDGACAAIQCKFYGRDAALYLDRIDRFIAASEPKHVFAERYFVWTGDDPSEPAKRRMEQADPICTLISREKLASWEVNWLELYEDWQHSPVRYGKKHEPREDQEEAIEAVLNGFAEHDRGQLILPCGTGKTATTLWLAERQVGAGGRVLYLVPSIALISQSMREWARHRRLEHRYIAVCSDRSVGRLEEDRTLAELDIPATTTALAIERQLRKSAAEKLTVVFGTYQSLERIAEAQDYGAPAFDLVICDEAHRTTGVSAAVGEHSPFTLVHDETRIRAAKRLFTTATPRIYRPASKQRAKQEDLTLFSMDDTVAYGPEFHRMTFGAAISKKLLSDYKVSILCINRKRTAERLREIFSELEEDGIDDLARMIGCWDALADPEGALQTRKFSGAIGENPCTTALAFTNTIQNSKNLRALWEEYIPKYRAYQEKEFDVVSDHLLQAEVEHVDGTDSALVRHERLRWLEGVSDEHHYDERGRLRARILSNARCLTEGVDVPALDAILFTAPRKSTVDIVQAVGRVMRLAQNKQYGYIILPVVIDEGQQPEQILEDSAFKMVWDVLSALRSHDNRLDAQVSLNFRQKLEDRIFILNGSAEEAEADDELPEQPGLPIELADIPPGLIYAKIIEKVGDREYLPKWASNVAAIYERLRERIAQAFEQGGVEEVDAGFQGFLDELKRTINPTLRAQQAIDLLAQHMLTGPVFDASFAESGFAQRNPVARALSQMVAGLERRYGVLQETRELRDFYEKVRTSFEGMEPAHRREAMQSLYEEFFRKALNKEATRLGVVYTPAPLVDFLLRSADWALQEHFGLKLADEDVHVIDPFTGTGTFLARLIENEKLLPDEALAHKYHHELHANEILLLAYYIAAVNLSQAYEERGQAADGAAEFPGLVWTDTFQLAERELQEQAAGEKLKGLGGISAENDERILRQRQAPITVIVGNPPYRAGQKSADDDNPNVEYELLEGRITDTYAARSMATNKNSLYDHYKLAIRWATDRVGKQGVVAFVSNASFIDGNAEAGLRACWQEEFAAAYVYHLRGAALQGRAEGQNVFDIRQPVALMLLVKDEKYNGPCEIRYTAMPDHAKQVEKFDLLNSAQHWGEVKTQNITPDKQHSWINQRDESFDEYLPIGSKEVKAGKAQDAVFILYSAGLKTGRDPWLNNSDQSALSETAQQMIDYYEGQRERIRWGEIDYETAIVPEPQKIKWDRELKNFLRRELFSPHTSWRIQASNFRPFYGQYLYYDPFYSQMPYQIPRMFPPPVASQPPSLPASQPPARRHSANRLTNQAIYLAAPGSSERFSCLLTERIPDLHLINGGQCFPRYTYRPVRE